MKLFIQSLVLIISFAIVYIWQKTPLSEYTIPSLGFLVFLFILTSARKKKVGAAASFTKSESTLIFTLNTVIFLLIFSTGGFSSSLFFILYFLGFGIAFIFEPQTVFVFTLGAFLVFLPDALRDNVTDNLLRIGSLVLLSPLAYFFGKSYRREEKQQSHIEDMEERTKDAADTISSDVEEVLKNEKENLKTEDVEKLNEILEETEDLREETKK